MLLNLLELCFDDFFEFREWLCARDALTVDEEVWGSTNTNRVTKVLVTFDDFVVLWVVESGLELGDIKAELFCISGSHFFNVYTFVLRHVGEDLLFHLPEFALLASSDEGFGESWRLSLESKWVVLEDQFDVVRVLLLKLLECL